MKNTSKCRMILMLSITPLSVSSICAQTTDAKNTKCPNFIIIFTDDQGFNDLGCYGSPKIKTPNIDKMAQEGMRFTDFYVSASVSSASRAGLLTGQLNTRNGVSWVFFPNENGLSKEKLTLAERLKDVGYSTACFGKWHLGDLPGHLPTDRGFDEYLGIPYSNGMYISPALDYSHDVNFREGYTKEKADKDKAFVVSKGINPKDVFAGGLRGLCPLVKDSLIVEYPCDQSSLTRKYFEYAMDFISRNDEKPFFCYITPNMPHVPLYASPKFKGSSKRGLYGDVVQEIDYYVGELMDFLKENNLDENTLVLFASDNGPWMGKGINGGSAKPFRAGKFYSYEGGVRLPFIAHWTGTIPPHSVNKNIFSAVDIVPTIMNLAGNTEPMDVDGYDELPTFLNPNVKIRDHYLYVNNSQLRGIRVGDWIYLPYSGGIKPSDKHELFNIREDIAEEKNLYDKNPERVDIMKKIFKRYQRMYPDAEL